MVPVGTLIAPYLRSCWMPSEDKSEARATDATRRALAAASERLPMQDRQDFADAERGFIGRS